MTEYQTGSKVNCDPILGHLDGSEDEVAILVRETKVTLSITLRKKDYLYLKKNNNVTQVDRIWNSIDAH